MILSTDPAMHEEQAAEAPIIAVEDLRKSFDETTVLDGIDLEVARGQIVGYIGPNGAGKTTTVKILIGMLGEFTGGVRVCGFDVARDPIEVKQRVGYVPETAALYDALTPREFLQFVGSIHRMDRDVIEARARAMLGLFDLSAQFDQRMSSFSKGMRQKVLIVAGLIHNPDLIVMDEPLTGLDANSAVMVKEILSGLASRGKTIFYCSHVMDVVERVCDRIIILNKGKIIADGTFEQLQAGAQGASLEHLFTRLTSEGTHSALAGRFLEIFDGHVDIFEDTEQDS